MCPLKDRECIEQAAEEAVDSDCGNSCEGVYADVAKMSRDFGNSDYLSMIAKYKDYKRNFVRNIGFNSSHYEAAFGEYRLLILAFFWAE